MSRPAASELESPIRVMVVDDHEMVRSGLGAFLSLAPDIELVGEAASGEEAVRLCREQRPDVVLMDMVLPGIDGAEATRRIRAELPAIQVIALTSFLDADLVRRALQAGALSYLLKNVGSTELLGAIRAA